MSYPFQTGVANISQVEVGENGNYKDIWMGVVPAEVHHLVMVPTEVDLLVDVVSAEVQHLGFHHLEGIQVLML